MKSAESRIICVLSAAEKLRYSELRREMCNITDAILAATLKDLREDGIVLQDIGQETGCYLL